MSGGLADVPMAELTARTLAALDVKCDPTASERDRTVATVQISAIRREIRRRIERAKQARLEQLGL